MRKLRLGRSRVICPRSHAMPDWQSPDQGPRRRMCSLSVLQLPLTSHNSETRGEKVIGPLLTSFLGLSRVWEEIDRSGSIPWPILSPFVNPMQASVAVAVQAPGKLYRPSRSSDLCHAHFKDRDPGGPGRVGQSPARIQVLESGVLGPSFYSLPLQGPPGLEGGRRGLSWRRLHGCWAREEGAIGVAQLI